MWIGNEDIVKHEQYRDLQREAVAERQLRQARAGRPARSTLAWLLSRVQPPAEEVPTARRPRLSYRSEETAAL
jgi:hypothetical protein